MRRIVTIIISVIMGAALTVPICKAEFVEPENSFCIYGVSGMEITIEPDFLPEHSITYNFPAGSTHYNNPYVISYSQIQEWYSQGYRDIHFVCQYTSCVTLTSPDGIITAGSSNDTNVEFIISSDDGTPLSLVTKLLSLKRAYLFPVGSAPNVAGVTPTPFVNDGSDIVVDDDELKNTIGAIDAFQPFMQFIFKSVIPWAGFAAVIILVFATIKFMLRG